jgi:hypothetical protein
MGDGEFQYNHPSNRENLLNSPLCSDTRGTFRRARWPQRTFFDAGDGYVRVVQSLLGIDT